MKNTEINAVIVKAVEAGRIAGRQQAKDAQEGTKRRLYALPILIDKVKEDKAQLDELRKHGPKTTSKSIVRFSASGSRVSPEDAIEAVIADKTAAIAADELEIEKMESLLARVKDDPYYPVLTGGIFDHKSDEQLASERPCDVRTVQRNRARIIEDMAVWLYGSYAL